jgi:hypothetical protein
MPRLNLAAPLHLIETTTLPRAARKPLVDFFGLSLFRGFCVLGYVWRQRARRQELPASRSTNPSLGPTFSSTKKGGRYGRPPRLELIRRKR